ncbi:MAG: IS1182 family transposase [Candidatus Riflebacteria bacterium]|nr:IS1182 family transposase [Candidatus Riflebacteria bacterium]
MKVSQSQFSIPGQENETLSQETIATEDKSKSIPPKLKPVDRRQMILRSIEIEELIPLDHEARAIWEFVGRLDLTPYYGEIRSKEGAAGRSSFDPQLMICLWIYAYSKGIATAREIAKLCEYDPAYQWLSGMDSINHHSISDFRIAHKEPLDKLLVEILAILSSEQLITLERVMHDGTKIKAKASGKSFRREKALSENLKIAQEHVAAIDELQKEDEENTRQRRARERVVRERKEKLEKAFSELEMLRKIKRTKVEKEEARASMTDPEARIMKQNGGGFAPSYNVQISTDSANGLIVGIGVSQAGNDTHELIPAVERIKEKTGQTPKQMVTDSGFTTKANIIEMSERKIGLIGSIKEKTSTDNIEKRGGDSKFDLNAFSYNPEDDTYSCPAGEIMRLHHIGKSVGTFDHVYFTEKGTCRKCQFQAGCCPQNSLVGRSIHRKEDSPIMDAFRKKMKTQEAKDIYKKRAQVAEFPNAWIKEKIGLRQFSVASLIKVEMEAVWVAITYNIMRWIGYKWRSRWETNGV